MATILAVYGTAYGQTERIIRQIGDRLRARGLAFTAYKVEALPSGLDLDRFDGFLIGASVMLGRHQPTVRDFFRREVERLNRSASAFVSVSGSAGSPLAGKHAEARGYLEEFLRQTGWRPTLTATFGGALAYTKYGFFLRWIIKRVARQSGGPTDTTRDHDTTDWAAVDRFAERVADTMLHPVGP